MKERYDVILLSLPSQVESSLSKTFFAYANVMVLRLEGPSYSALMPYFIWGREGNSLAFV